MAKKKIRIGIIGATGSVGRQTLDVIADNEKLFDVAFLTANTDSDGLLGLAERFRPQVLALSGAESCRQKKTFESAFLGLKEHGDGYNPEVIFGQGYYKELIKKGELDILVVASSGLGGLEPTIFALKKSIDVALANKESLVAAGSFIMKEAKQNGARIIPIDSEHMAVAEALGGNKTKSVSRIILTASGGPFRKYSYKRLEGVTLEQALRHPTWKMGKKVTIDSATLMNKGFEIIEASHLFGMRINKIETVIHPESVIHALVEYIDNTSVAAMSIPDMRIPISRAIGLGSRLKNSSTPLYLAALSRLTFERPDEKKFPLLSLAREVALEGGILPVSLVAADDVAVDLFLNGRIRFTEIYGTVSRLLDRVKNFRPRDVDEILAIKNEYGKR